MNSKNFDALRADLRSRFNWEATDNVVRVDNALNEAYAELLAMADLPIVGTTTTVAVTSATTTIALPADFGRATGVFIRNSEDGWELVQTAWATEILGFGDPAMNERGTPKRYLADSVASGSLGARVFQMRVMPYPDGNYTIFLAYQAVVAALAAATDVPAFDRRWHHLIPERAALKIAPTAGMDPQNLAILRATHERNVAAFLASGAPATSPNAQVPRVGP